MAIMPIGQIVFGTSFDSHPAYLVVFPAALILFLACFVYRKLTCGKEKDVDVVVEEN